MMRTVRIPMRAGLAAATAIAIALSWGGAALAADGDASDFADDTNLVRNPDFASSYDGWSAYSLSGKVEDGAFCGSYFGPHFQSYNSGFGFNAIALPAGDYYASFSAYASADYEFVVQETLGEWTHLYDETIPASDDFTFHEAFFSSDTPFPTGEYQFHLGTREEGTQNFCVENALLAVHPKDYVTGGGFDGGLGAWKVTGAKPALGDAGMCVTVAAGTTASGDVAARLTGVDLPEFSYTLNYDAAGAGGSVRAVVTSHGDPGVVYSDVETDSTADAETVAAYFDVPEGGDTVDVELQFGGAGGEVCVDNVQVLSGGEPAGFEPDTGPRVRVNQLGYVADGPKRATMVTDTQTPVQWKLVDEAGATVKVGGATEFGVDAASGLAVQLIDFTDVVAEGMYTIEAEGVVSYPFEISAGLYDQLRYDALNYFYLARSGIEIDAAIVGDDYAREAGHVSRAGGGDVNQGDLGVACQPAGDSEGIYGEPWTCDYTLDVAGGWYDAGDHGKYVVNGGIAVYQLMSAYERSLRAKDAGLGDSVLNLPEVDNGVPDILDEARWELDFILSMQVPDGDPYAGMAHHKIHDFSWTGLPLMPADDPNTRYLHRPSTAATLNLAATAAQGARLFGNYDGDYADQLLASAELAWDAAVANPEVYAPVADGGAGGGPYDDDDVTDEFYWAAAELYLTTGEAEYEEFLLASPLHGEDVFGTGGFDWGNTAALGRLDLATVPSGIADREAIQGSVVAAADAILAVQQAEGFGQALGAEDFVWGSNALVLNNQVVIATAYDLTGEAKYLDGVRESVDYLLGRNALNQSYVTGYGTVSSQNQHSRWFANQLDPAYPNPPVGSVAGGPNADVGSWDPAIASLYPNGDCAPQACYVDDINSWSSNEITVNWNSALSWVAVFLAAPDAPVGAGGGLGAPWWAFAFGGLALGGLGWASYRFVKRGREGA